MASKDLVIELTKATASFPKGTQLGVDTEGAAKKVYGDDYKIVGYQDGSAYEAPKPADSAPAASADGASA